MKDGCGLILAAPSSGSGKTTVTLGLLRALKQRGINIRGAKSGPDYIDPRFHEAATGTACFNLDAWAMKGARINMLAAGAQPMLIEGAMGLFDGAPPDGRGSVADLARLLKLPVIMVIDAARMAQSVAPVLAGFAQFDPEVQVAGVILNKVGSARHETMLRRALAPLNIPVLGAVPRSADIQTPSRHLGLVQAQERSDLEDFIERAAALVTECVDIQALCALAKPLPISASSQRIAPPAQNIAVAQDRAFAFAYPHILQDWQAAGAQITPFSPLADHAVPDCDFVFLPGGYPELYAGQLAQATGFLHSLRAHSETRAVYGECGGYMLLGEGLVDAAGTRHKMAGLLSLETSFEQRKLHLGYRQLQAQNGPFQGRWNAHEFHYASTLHAKGTPLFDASDAEGTALAPMGLRQGKVAGSFAHLIDNA